MNIVVKILKNTQREIQAKNFAQIARKRAMGLLPAASSGPPSIVYATFW